MVSVIKTPNEDISLGRMELDLLHWSSRDLANPCQGALKLPWSNGGPTPSPVPQGITFTLDTVDSLRPMLTLSANARKSVSFI